MTRRTPRNRADYASFVTVATRWNDNDQYGHVYQGTYIELFDCAVNDWLVHDSGIDPREADSSIVVVENAIAYFREVSYPDRLEIGLGLTRLGGASLNLRLGMFRAGEDAECAQMDSVLVNVTPKGHAPLPWAEAQRAMWQKLAVDADAPGA